MMIAITIIVLIWAVIAVASLMRSYFLAHPDHAARMWKHFGPPKERHKYQDWRKFK